jgi:hypothetical protein
MNVQELADKFTAKVSAAVTERDRQTTIATEQSAVRTDDIEHCKNAMERNVLPFLEELKTAMPDGQFSFAHQIDRQDHKPVGVSFRIGDGPATTIATAFGNVIVTSVGHSSSSKGVSFVYPPDAEPYISNSGDLTRDKIAKLVEMVIDNEL